MRTDIITLAKNKEFLKLWMSYLLSSTTGYILSFVLMDQVYSQTKSSFAVGLLWAFYLLPTLIIGPFSGVILDYLNKKWLLVGSSLLQIAGLLLFFPVGGRIWMFYGLLMLYSFFDEFFTPTVAVLGPSLVAKKQLPLANSIALFTGQGSMALGFLAGGLYLKIIGFNDSLFALLALLLLISVASAFSLNWREKITRKKWRVNLESFWEKLTEGYSFIIKEPLVLLPVLFIGGLQVVIGMAVVLLPAIAENIAGIKLADSSYLLILPAIAGALTGSVLVQRLNRAFLKRVLIINGLFILGVIVFIIGAVLPRVSWSLAGSVLAAFLGAGSFVSVLIPLQVMVQEKTPLAVRGRVFGVLNTLVTIGAAIPAVGAVTLVDLIGIKTVLGVTGLGIITLALYIRQGKYGIITNGK